MSLTKETLAALLNGREYGSEIMLADEAQAKAAGLVVLFGYSDDNAEFRGAIHDEAGCLDGGKIFVDAKGILPNWESASEDPEAAKAYLARKPSCREIEARWCDEPSYSWTYKTDIPHATFEVVEDGEKYCRGIVFSIADIPGGAS